MALNRLVRVPTRVLMVSVLACASFGFSSCSGSPQLPDDARAALMAYWESLPSNPEVENRIMRAWPGEANEDVGSGALPKEVWCVEAEISSANDPSVDGELLVWIVTRKYQEARWSAALLASLSSTWPYQACGETPG